MLELYPSESAMYESTAEWSVAIRAYSAKRPLFLLTCSFSLVSLPLLYFLFFSRRIKGKRAPSADGALPLIGHVLALDESRIIDFFLKSWRAAGKNTFELNLAGKRGLVIGDWETAKAVFMARPKTFRRSPVMEGWAKDLQLTSGLFNVDGAEWHRIRRLTSPPFSGQSVEDAFERLVATTQEHFIAVRNAAMRDGSVQVADGMKLMAEYTTKQILQLAFGEAASEVTYLKDLQITTDLNLIFKWVHRRSVIPLPKFVWDYFVKDKLERDFSLKYPPLHNCVEQIIANCRAARNSNSHATSGKKANFITKMMQANASELGSRACLTDQELAAQVKTFLLAGVETTSGLIASTLLCLMRCDGEIALDALRAELEAVIPERARGITSLDQLEKLPLLKATVKEANRLHTPGPIIFAQVAGSEDVELAGGYVVHPGDEVFLPSLCLMRDDDIFTEPDSFDPFRWLPNATDSERLTRMNERYCAFGFGPRRCPGMRLAYMEAYLAIAFILLNFDISIDCDPNEIFDVMAFTCHPNKLPMRFTAR